MNGRNLVSTLLLASLVTPLMGAGPAHAAPQTCVDPPSGLAGWWAGDGTGEDELGNFNATLKNGITFAPGVVGDAFSLDNRDDRGDIGYSEAFNIPPDGAWTIETWVQPVPDGTFGAILVKSDKNGNWDYGLYLDTSKKFMAGRANANILKSTTVAQPNTWYHVAATYSNQHWVMYVNGVMENAVEGTAILQSTGGLSIGVRGDSGFDPYGGLIDEVSIYHRVLTPEEILAIYQAGADGKCKPLHSLAVNDVNAIYRTAQSQATARVSIFSTLTGSPVVNAMVLLQAQTPSGASLQASGVTDDLGVALISFPTTEAGEFTFAVLDVTKSDWMYDPSQNRMTSLTIILPYPFHVAAIDPHYALHDEGYRVWATVRIESADEVVVPGTSVDVVITLPGGATVLQRARTQVGGLALFSLFVSTPGTYTFTVTDAARANWQYDAASNVETSDSITIP